jgi:hypothetical protein
LRFSNSGTTTIAVNRFRLYSGTAILLDETSGNVFINNTETRTSGTTQAVIVETNQIWRNNSATGTLSVQATSGAIRLINSETPNPPTTLTLAGPGAFTLGRVNGGAGAALIFDGTGLLTIGGAGVTGATAFTLNNSGTVRNATTSGSTPFGTGLTTINGGAIEQVGTGTVASGFLMNNSFSLLSGTLQQGTSSGTTFSTGTSAVT